MGEDFVINGESEQEKNARLVQEYMRLNKELESSSVEDLERDLSSRVVVSPDGYGEVSRYRRLLEIGGYLKSLTGEQFVEMLSYENFPPTAEQVGESEVYRGLVGRYIQLAESIRTRISTSVFQAQAFQRFQASGVDTSEM